MADTIIVNGEVTDKISAYDRGLAYGDGVFETILAKNAKLYLWEQHIQRLTRSLDKLHFDSNLQSNELQSLIIKHLKTDIEQVVKILVTRGNSQRGYKIPGGIEKNIIIYISDKSQPFLDNLKKGVIAITCKTRLGYQPILAGIKHLNRLEQVLACSELEETNCQEGVMLGYQGEVIEGIMHNLFLVKNGELFTPDLSLCGVAGIMRTFIIENAKQLKIPVHIERISVEQLMAADELFFSNSLNIIWPICELDGTRFTVGEVTYLLYNRVIEKMNQYA